MLSIQAHQCQPARAAIGCCECDPATIQDPMPQTLRLRRRYFRNIERAGAQILARLIVAMTGAMAVAMAVVVGGVWRRIMPLLALVLVVVQDAPATAHELNPAVARISQEATTGRILVAIEVNLEALLAGIGPEHDDTDQSPDAVIYDRYRGFAPGDLAAEFAGISGRFVADVRLDVDGARAALEVMDLSVPPVGDMAEPRVTTILLAAPGSGENVRLGWAREYGNLVVRAEAGAAQFAQMVTGGSQSPEIALARPEQGFWAALIAYIGVGFEHIIPLGADHILFVVGLFLLSTRMRPLLWQVTAFTLAHTVTLALGMLGILRIPAEIVEPIIAASIVYVAVENILSPTMTRWRPAIVFGFGLLHGLGFAGVLTAFGIPQAQFAAGLIGFNIGVELGQLAVIAVCFAVVGYWFGSKPWYRAVVIIPGSLAVALIAFYWVLERTVL